MVSFPVLVGAGAGAFVLFVLVFALMLRFRRRSRSLSAQCADLERKLQLAEDARDQAIADLAALRRASRPPGELDERERAQSRTQMIQEIQRTLRGFGGL